MIKHMDNSLFCAEEADSLQDCGQSWRQKKGGQQYMDRTAELVAKAGNL